MLLVMAMSNPSWGEERIANGLLPKLGICVSPRSVRKYRPRHPRGYPREDQRWSTLVRNHASIILACDFCVVVTATFRLLYVFIVIEHQTRRIEHCITTNRVTHYNQGPLSSIGPGIPDPPSELPASPPLHRHRIPDNLEVVVHPILGGLHHEYSLLPKAA
jgi:hypothetical protein